MLLSLCRHWVCTAILHSNTHLNELDQRRRQQAQNEKHITATTDFLSAKYRIKTCLLPASYLLNVFSFPRVPPNLATATECEVRDVGVFLGNRKHVQVQLPSPTAAFNMNERRIGTFL